MSNENITLTEEKLEDCIGEAHFQGFYAGVGACLNKLAELGYIKKNENDILYYLMAEEEYKGNYHMEEVAKSYTLEDYQEAKEYAMIELDKIKAELDKKR